jgi:hypothetical protein
MNTAKPLLPKNFPQLLTGLALISLSLVVSTAIAAKAVLEVKKNSDVLVVTGSAKRPITSDYIVLPLSVSSQQPTAQMAYQDLKSQTERVQAYLKEKNVPAEAITLGTMETYAIPEITENGQETGETLAYRLTQRFEISADDVERYSKLSQESTELINEGINLKVESPQYLYTELAPLRIEMVAEATKDAKARAEAIASNTNSQVGPVRSAQTGVFQITARNSTDVSDMGTYDTSSIDKDITAVVSITFSMK